MMPIRVSVLASPYTVAVPSRGVHSEWVVGRREHGKAFELAAVGGKDVAKVVELLHLGGFLPAMVASPL